MDAKRKKELKEILMDMKALKLTEIKQNAEEKENADSYQHDAQDFADTATNAYDKDIHLELTEKNKKMLIDIEDALNKIEEGRFGKCERCARDISIERLKVLPFSKLCIKCQSGTEKK
ncbi:MAG: TraR/DksA family transcriptional regulator [Spirochaetia bacterium]|nr:TraR/DksA family transcriptional regulator [Spirochaetia bacterium]